MTNYFKGFGKEGELTGMSLILGSYCLHMLECENSLMKTILTSLNDFTHTSTLYQQIWIIHQTEEVL